MSFSLPDYSIPTSIQLSDIFGLIGLFIFVLATLTLAEILRRKEKVSGSTSRKIVHLAVGNVVIIFPFVFSSIWYALIGPVFFIPFTYFTCPASPVKKFRLKGVEAGHTYGTVFYAISLTILTSLFFSPDASNQNNIILIGSFLPLVWGDGIGAVIGSKFGNDKAYKIFGGTKTLLGSWAAAFATFISVTLGCLILFQSLESVEVCIYIGLLSGFVTAFIEALTPKGFDNIAVPLVNAIVLFGLYNLFHQNLKNLNEELSIISIIIAAVVGLIIAILSIIFKALTWDGAIAGFYFGIVILGLGSWTWGVMYFTFFILGSLSSFIGKKKKESISQEYEKGDTARDSVQAMVNSIIPAIMSFLIVLIRNEPIIIIIGAGAIAVSLADTLGTELGALSRKEPHLSIKPWIKVPRGTPGAISLLGIISSIIGSTIIAIIGIGIAQVDKFVKLKLLNSLLVLPSTIWLFVIPIIVGGTMGAYIDSISACTIQKMNKCIICGKITEKKEHCQEKTIYHSGIKWIRNDFVNLFSIILGSIISLLCYLIATCF